MQNHRFLFNSSRQSTRLAALCCVAVISGISSCASLTVSAIALHPLATFKISRLIHACISHPFLMTLQPLHTCQETQSTNRNCATRRVYSANAQKPRRCLRLPHLAPTPASPSCWSPPCSMLASQPSHTCLALRPAEGL